MDKGEKAIIFSVGVKGDCLVESSGRTVASTAIAGGLISGVSGAIVAAAAVPFLLKVVEATKDKSDESLQNDHSPEYESR